MEPHFSYRIPQQMAQAFTFPIWTSKKISIDGATFQYQNSIDGPDSKIFNFKANCPTHGINTDFQTPKFFYSKMGTQPTGLNETGNLEVEKGHCIDR